MMSVFIHTIQTIISIRFSRLSATLYYSAFCLCDFLMSPQLLGPEPPTQPSHPLSCNRLKKQTNSEKQKKEICSVATLGRGRKRHILRIHLQCLDMKFSLNVSKGYITGQSWPGCGPATIRILALVSLARCFFAFLEDIFSPSSLDDAPILIHPQA